MKGWGLREIGFVSLNLPLLLAGLAVALAVAPVLWFIVRFLQEGEGGGSIIANDGWGVLPILCVPTVVTLAGFVALARWESRAARRSAWAVALVFLVAMLISMGAGPYFWPAAAALLLAASVRQGSWWTISGAWLVSLLLMLAAYSMTGVGSFFWSSGVVLLLATGTLGARLLGGGRLS